MQRHGIGDKTGYASTLVTSDGYLSKSLRIAEPRSLAWLKCSSTPLRINCASTYLCLQVFAVGGANHSSYFSHIAKLSILILLDNTDTFFDIVDKIFHNLYFILLCVSLHILIWENHLVEFMVNEFANGKFDYFPL